MTLKEAAEAGRLVETLRLIEKEGGGLDKIREPEIAFNEESFFDRGCFIAMIVAGRKYTVDRLKALGVEDLPAKNGGARG